MLSAPRTEQPRCTCNTCPTCTDDLSVWLNELPPRDGDSLAPVDLNRRRSTWPTWRRRNG